MKLILLIQKQIPEKRFHILRCFVNAFWQIRMASFIALIPLSIQIIPELRITFNQSRSFLTIIAFHTFSTPKNSISDNGQNKSDQLLRLIAFDLITIYLSFAPYGAYSSATI